MFTISQQNKLQEKSCKNYFIEKVTFFLSVSIYFETERAQAGERLRKRERIPRRLWAVSTEPDAGIKLMNHETIP